MRRTLIVWLALWTVLRRLRDAGGLRRALIALLALCVLVPLAEAATLQGTVTHVSDGDTLWLRLDSGGAPVQVRLQGIDAPEICQAHGTAARDALTARVRGQRVQLRTRARDAYHRTLGRVATSRDGDVGATLVLQGHAWSPRYQRRAGPYDAQQAQAQAARRGLWAQGDAEEPRQFRKRHGSCR